jgi:hypothetical protein
LSAFNRFTQKSLTEGPAVLSLSHDPQWWQNSAPGSSSAPQPEQACANGVPPDMQNFAPAGFSVEQDEQIIG